ncbi:MAG: hypothetical protein LBC84_03500 [Prevotellaceae bacterium]|nr:hypothetical protein [Prevotellaceae bacterium]
MVFLHLCKADETPRWESGATIEKNHLSGYTFITDQGSNLFTATSLAKYKIGRITATDGSTYEIVEFTGPLAKGKPADGQLRTESGLKNLYRLEIVEVAPNGVVWMVFQETVTSAERRVVLII